MASAVTDADLCARLTTELRQPLSTAVYVLPHCVEGNAAGMSDYDRMNDYDMIDENLDPGDIRISRRLDYGHGPMRYVTMRLNDDERTEHVMEKGEVVLRTTPKGVRTLVARFYESDRMPIALTLQYRNEQTGRPHTGGISLRADEIPKFLEFLDSIRRVHLMPGRMVVESGALEHPNFTDDALLAAIRTKPDLAAEIVETQATSRDVKAVAYRRKALERFRTLLYDDEFFDAEVRNAPRNSRESVWQNFFEENQWIFGYGLSYIFLTAADPEKLRRAVSGFSLAVRGKEPDAVMRTRGAVSALCLIEVKTDGTELLRRTATRPGAYGPSADLTNAISQAQASISGAERQLEESFQPTDERGDPVSEMIFRYRPRSYLVIGTLNEFCTEHGVNKDQYRSFEMFRRNLTAPEIITFDELYTRAAYIVENIS